MKVIALVLLKLFLITKFSKIFLSIVLMILSLGAYAITFGWKYALGFVSLIFFHEMGHYLAAKQKNLDVGLPTFIPFLGAWIDLKETPMNAEVEAYVAYAGPLVGTFSAFAFYFTGREINSALLIALAQIGFIINLFNLIPLPPLDGGRITAVISPRVWFLGAPLLIAVWLCYPSPIFIIISILAVPQLLKAWNYDPKDPKNKDYYNISYTARFEYAVLYLGLVVVLGLMITYQY